MLQPKMKELQQEDKVPKVIRFASELHTLERDFDVKDRFHYWKFRLNGQQVYSFKSSVGDRKEIVPKTNLVYEYGNDYYLLTFNSNNTIPEINSLNIKPAEGKLEKIILCAIS